MRSRLIKGVVGVTLAVAVLVTGGTWAYINLFRDDAPERLTLDAAGAPTGPTPTTAAAGGFDSLPGEGQEVRATAQRRARAPSRPRPVGRARARLMGLGARR